MTGSPLIWLLLSLGAYLIGSVPFGLLIGLARGVDIRQHGSKNIGATNAGRVLGRKWGVLCFVLDALKGAAPVIVAGKMTGVWGVADPAPAASLAWLGVGVAALIGHMFPVWLRFKGGKGVATGFGAMVATWPGVTLPAAAALLAWIVALKITRYVSVSSCVAACVLPVSLAALRAMGWPVGGTWTGAWAYLGVTTLLGAMVVWKHRANFARLRAGTEPKVGRPKPAPTPGNA